MRVIQILIYLTFFTAVAYSQEYKKEQLDSLYNAFMEIHNTQDNSVESSENIKCTFGIVNQLIRNIDNYPEQQKQLLKSLLERPIKQKSIVSPENKP